MSILSVYSPSFNPRSRAGSDALPTFLDESSRVSIHAPARGATVDPDRQPLLFVFQSTLPRGERPIDDKLFHVFIGFQSTLPRGERPQICGKKISTKLFQSTLPRGERHALSVRLSLGITCFNPRSRAGSDTAGGTDDCGWRGVSIHAPARGATLRNYRCCTGSHVSIHAPARGATRLSGD